MNNKQIKSRVMNIMIRNKKTRDNDNLLIAKALKELYGSTDIAEIAQVETTSICETITRMRRMIQRSNPLLGPSKNVSKRRQMREEEFKEMARGI